MRWHPPIAALTLAALLGGCDVTPQSLGITGPGQRTEPLANQPNGMPDDATLRPPGVPDFSSGTATGQRFYGYN